MKKVANGGLTVYSRSKADPEWQLYRGGLLSAPYDVEGERDPTSKITVKRQPVGSGSTISSLIYWRDTLSEGP